MNKGDREVVRIAADTVESVKPGDAQLTALAEGTLRNKSLQSFGMNATDFIEAARAGPLTPEQATALREQWDEHFGHLTPDVPINADPIAMTQWVKPAPPLPPLDFVNDFNSPPKLLGDLIVAIDPSTNPDQTIAVVIDKSTGKVTSFGPAPAPTANPNAPATPEPSSTTTTDAPPDFPFDPDDE